MRPIFIGRSLVVVARSVRLRASQSRSGSASPIASRPSPTTKSEPVIRIGAVVYVPERPRRPLRLRLDLMRDTKSGGGLRDDVWTRRREGSPRA